MLSFAPAFRHFASLCVPVMVICEPELIKQVLRNYETWPKRLNYLFLLLGDSIVTMDGSAWHSHRQLVSLYIYRFFGILIYSLDDWIQF